MQAGLVFQKHVHHGNVYDYTLRGQWAYQEFDHEMTFKAGDFVSDDGGFAHTLYNPGNDTAEVFYWGNGAMVCLCVCMTHSVICMDSIRE